MLKNKVKNIDKVFYTHSHADQTHGINELRVFSLKNKKKIPIYADKITYKNLKNTFGYCFKNYKNYPSILDAKILKTMKSNAIIINTARGGIINEHALYQALISGEIKGAGLDVLLDEPSAADHPLFSLKNVLLSPHIAGVTVESTQRMATQTVDNVLRVFDGNIDPECVVNQSVLSSSG